MHRIIGLFRDIPKRLQSLFIPFASLAKQFEGVAPVAYLLVRHIADHQVRLAPPTGIGQTNVR